MTDTETAYEHYERTGEYPDTDDESTLPAAAFEDDDPTADPEPTDPDELDADDQGELDAELPVATGPAPGELTAREVEQRGKQFDGENARHTKRLRQIMGDDFALLVPCEACFANTPGYHWPADAFAEGSPERMTYNILSGGAEALPVQPSHLHTCKACNGLGTWQTGSRNPGCTAVTCTNCAGKGYTEDRVESAVQTLPSATMTVELAPPPPPVELPATDHIGRPKGHPNYGLYPIYMTQAQKELDDRDGFGVL